MAVAVPALAVKAVATEAPLVSAAVTSVSEVELAATASVAVLLAAVTTEQDVLPQASVALPSVTVKVTVAPAACDAPLETATVKGRGAPVATEPEGAVTMLMVLLFL